MKLIFTPFVYFFHKMLVFVSVIVLLFLLIINFCFCIKLIRLNFCTSIHTYVCKSHFFYFSFLLLFAFLLQVYFNYNTMRLNKHATTFLQTSFLSKILFVLSLAQPCFSFSPFLAWTLERPGYWYFFFLRIICFWGFFFLFLFFFSCSYLLH